MKSVKRCDKIQNKKLACHTYDIRTKSVKSTSFCEELSLLRLVLTGVAVEKFHSHFFRVLLVS